MKKFLAMILALVMALSLVACGSKDNDQQQGGDVSGDKVIKVGVFEPTSGQNAGGGKKEILGIEYAHSLKPTVTINGEEYSVQLVYADNASDANKAPSAAQTLISQGVSVVIGTYGSAVTEATQNILAESELVQIGTGSTSVRLTEKGLPLFFRTCPRDDAQGKAAAAAIIKAGYKKVALLHDNSSYAKGLAEESQAALEKAGVKIIFYDALTPGERDYTAILTKLKAANPDLIFFTGYYPETGMLLRQKKEMGWDVPMMGGDAANHQDLVKIAGPEAAAGYFFVSPPLPQDMDTDEAKNFLKAFKDRYKTVPVSVWAVLAGDAYKVLEAAIAKGNDDPEKIAEWLKQLKELPTLSGKMGFDEKGDRVGDFYRIYKVNNAGKFELQAR